MNMPRAALFLATVTACLLAAPAGVAAPLVDGVLEPTGLISSDNIELVTALPNPGVIGARFRGNVMYVTSVTGLTTYDISTPAAPVELGRLPLPHFENEDVDLGGNILLISNDAAESAGLLHIIDISDPAKPTLLTTHDMGGNAVTAQTFGGPGHTASCILECRYAWVTDGAAVRVIDLTNPAAPVSKGTFATPVGGGIAVHDVQVDENGLAWVVGFGGAAVYQLPADYAGEGLGEMLAKTNAQGMSTYITNFGTGDGKQPNDFILHNSRRTLDSDVVYVTEEDYNRPGCQGAGQFETWRLPMREDELEDGTKIKVITGEDLTPIDLWVTELNENPRNAAAGMCSAHYFDLRGGVVAQGWYEQGLRVLDVSQPDNIRQIGFFVLPNAMTWAAYFAPSDPTGSTLYVFDASHGIDVVHLDLPDGPAEARTVRAPIRPSWTKGASTAVPDARFGYACRILR